MLISDSNDNSSFGETDFAFLAWRCNSLSALDKAGEIGFLSNPGSVSCGISDVDIGLGLSTGFVLSTWLPPRFSWTPAAIAQAGTELSISVLLGLMF